VRVLLYEHGSYKLQSKWGHLTHRYPGSDLLAVSESTAEILGRSILVEPGYKRGQEVVISLSMAVSKENDQGSIENAQKAGRAVERVAAGASNINTDTPAEVATGASNRAALDSSNGTVSKLKRRQRRTTAIARAGPSEPTGEVASKPELPLNRSASKPDLPPIASIRKGKREAKAVVKEPPPTVSTTKGKRKVTAITGASELDLAPRKLRKRG
jgi:hypothetical protein